MKPWNYILKKTLYNDMYIVESNRETGVES